MNSPQLIWITRLDETGHPLDGPITITEGYVTFGEIPPEPDTDETWGPLPDTTHRHTITGTFGFGRGRAERRNRRRFIATFFGIGYTTQKAAQRRATRGRATRNDTNRRQARTGADPGRHASRTSRPAAR